MLNPECAKQRAARIDEPRATCDVAPSTLPGITDSEGADTIDMTMVDKDGNIVSLIQSNYSASGVWYRRSAAVGRSGGPFESPCWPVPTVDRGRLSRASREGERALIVFRDARNAQVRRRPGRRILREDFGRPNSRAIPTHETGREQQPSQRGAETTPPDPSHRTPPWCAPLPVPGRQPSALTRLDDGGAASRIPFDATGPSLLGQRGGRRSQALEDELLHPFPLVGFGDVDVALRIDRHTVRPVELPCPVARAAK
jgi:hypothetical protein